MPEKNLTARGLDAARAYLGRVGMWVETTEGTNPITALDEGTRVLVWVKTSRAVAEAVPTPPKTVQTRARREGARLDVIRLLLIGEDSALLCHVRNVNPE